MPGMPQRCDHSHCLQGNQLCFRKLVCSMCQVLRVHATLPQDRGHTTLVDDADALLTLRKSVCCMRPVLMALMEYSAMCIKGCLDTCGLAGMPAVTSRCSCTNGSTDHSVG